jgi:hypothetical protein
MREMNESRRRFGVGVLAAVGGGLLTRTAEGFPAGAAGDFNAATHVLRRYGVSVGGAFDAAVGRDVLTVTSIPQAQTQHDFVVAELTSEGTVVPCYRTSSFDGSATFIHYSPGGIDPCLKVAVVGPLMTYELIDPSDGDIIPCIRVAAEHTADGGLGPIVVTADPDEDLRMVIGSRSYRLIDGQLVDESAPR